MKQCTSCDSYRAISEFRVHKKSPGGLHSWCKACNNAYNSNYRKIKPEQKRKDQRLYRKRHPEKVNADRAKRDAYKLQRTPKWLTTEHFDQIEQFYNEAKELTWLSIDPLEVDHIIPLKGRTVSGLHVPWNLQILPRKINSSKGNRLS